MPVTKSSAGFSLIEVLVAVLVLAVGMLGIAAMQATALRNSQSAFQRSQGVIQTYSIIDSMRANRAEAIISRYDLADWTCDPPDPDTLPAADLALWLESIEQALGPDACGRIDCGSDACVVEVRWNDSRGSGDFDALEEFTVVTRTVL